MSVAQSGRVRRGAGDVRLGCPEIRIELPRFCEKLAVCAVRFVDRDRTDDTCRECGRALTQVL